MCFLCGNAHALCRFYHACWTVFFTLFRNFFPRFADNEEPVKVLKVGFSACRVACGEVDWYKANPLACLVGGE